MEVDEGLTVVAIIIAVIIAAVIATGTRVLHLELDGLVLFFLNMVTAGTGTDAAEAEVYGTASVGVIVAYIATGTGTRRSTCLDGVDGRIIIGESAATLLGK